jgi:biopolymer transport protein ExbD
VKKRERRKGDAVKLEMTPMIDVVFQLLIFFIVTLKQEDILSHLDVFRPAPDPNAPPPEEKPQDLLTIVVHRNGFMLKDRPSSIETIEKQLVRLASYSKNISVIIKCTGDSPHAKLIQILDVCSKAGLKNLSVFRM